MAITSQNINYTGLSGSHLAPLNFAFGIPDFIKSPLGGGDPLISVFEISVPNESLTYELTDNDNMIRIYAGASTPTNGTFAVRLNVPTEEFVRTITGGNVFKEDTLSSLFTQAIMVSGAVSEGRLTALADNLDMGTNKVVNLATGTADTDAVNVAQLNAKDQDFTNTLNATEAARDAALAAQTVSEGIQTDVTTKRDECTASAADSAVSAAASEVSRQAADTAVTSIGTSVTDAENARDASIDAQVASESARDLSQTYSTNSGISATNSANSATEADGYRATAQAASVTAGNASTAASAAQLAAEAARDAALAAFDNFDDRFLGDKASDPTLDNDGDSLVAGALYFNTTDSIMKVYTGTVWVAAYVSGTDFLAKANNLSDVANAGVARTNLGVEIGTDVQAHNAVLDATTASFTTAEKTKLGLIEDGATADQTGAEIKAAYEAEANTNAFTDAEKSKLGGVESNATADQSDAEIEAAYNAQVPVVSQADAEAGTSTTVNRWTPQRIAQAIAALGGGGGSSYMIVQDQKASGVSGGTFTSGAWQTRDLNTSVFNNITGASLSSNQITLPAGTYRVKGVGVARKVNQSQSRIVNVSGSAVSILGLSNNTSTGDSMNTECTAEGVFTIAGTSTIELQQQANTSRSTDGFGLGHTFGTNVFSQVTIEKIG